MFTLCIRLGCTSIWCCVFWLLFSLILAHFCIIGWFKQVWHFWWPYCQLYYILHRCWTNLHHASPHAQTIFKPSLGKQTKQTLTMCHNKLNIQIPKFKKWFPCSWHANGLKSAACILKRAISMSSKFDAIFGNSSICFSVMGT